MFAYLKSSVSNFFKSSLLILSLLIFTSVNSFGASPVVVRGEQGVVASRSAWASDVGVEIMKAGGNAYDAAVAVGFALAVTYPSAGNIGGGGFMVGFTAEGKQFALDFRETAPATATRDMYQDDQGKVIKGLSTETRLSAGVPGSVAGLLAALEKYGTLTRQQVMAPAIRLAEKGIVLNYDLVSQFNKHLETMSEFPASKKVFSKEGKAYAVGDLWQQPQLAKTLRRISEQGGKDFYEGETAKLLVAEMQRGNGLISLEDLKNYQVKWRQPIKSDYRGYTVWGMPPPSSGGILIAQMLNVFEAYDLQGMKWGSAELIHLMVEAQRRAYADRAEHLGDADFYPVPIAQLIDKDYARQRFRDFNPSQASDSKQIAPGEMPVLESPETTHYSVMDGKGNAVSVTTTLNLAYGNKIVVQGAGFLLNNEMDDFSSKPGVPNSYGLLGSSANAIEGGKRMLSSMSPTIVSKDGQAYLVTGSPGGSTIINTTLQVIVNVLDHKMQLNDAVALPRFHHQWQPDRIFYEPFAFSPDTQEKLLAMKHKSLTKTSWLIGDANSVMRIGDLLIGMSDPRNEGGASAY